MNVYFFSTIAKPAQNEFQILIDFFLKILPLGGWIFSIFVWWDAAGKKRYAAQLAFEKIERAIDDLVRANKQMVRLLEQHEQRTFEKYTQSVNEIFRKLDALLQDNNVEKQLLNNIQMWLMPNTSSGFSRKKDE